jgi:predicted GNAT family N-acyltransferase
MQEKYRLDGPSERKKHAVKLSRCLPSECMVEEIEFFSGLLCQAFGSRDRAKEIHRARSLIFLREVEQIAGVAALKAPKKSKVRVIFLSAGVSLEEPGVPCELGWVVVDERFRGRRYSRMLVDSALQPAGDADVFATSHDANTPMHKTLRRCGFTRAGNPYYSRRHKRKLVLFVRSGRFNRCVKLRGCEESESS